MKYLQMVLFAFALTMIMSVSVFAKINITSDDISGDDNLKNKIMSLQNEDTNYISPKAVYVATNGTDSSSSGTINKPYATVDYAIRKLASNDTIIYVRGGTYDQKIAPAKSGDSNNYITIKAYPNEKPVFEISSYGRIIDPNYNNYLCFDGLVLKAKEDSVVKSTHGIEMVEGNHIIFRNLEIYNINVPDPTSSSVATHAFNLYGSNASVPISNIVIENCYIHDMQTGWSEAIAVNGNSEYVNVINCKVSDIGNIGIDFAGNFEACKTPTLDQARYCVARGNQVSNCISPNARSYGLYNDGGRNNVFDRNIVYGCSGGIEIGSEEGGNAGKQNVTDITIINNLVRDNIEVGISVGGYSTTDASVGDVYNTKVYNNTVVNNGGTEININKTIGADFRNNIIYTKGKTAVNIEFSKNYIKDLNINNNLYYSTNGENKIKFTNYGEKVSGMSNCLDTNAVFANPNLDTNYMPQSNSPSIDMGDSSVVDIVGGYDLGNNSRVRGVIDSGCYEYQAGDVVTTQTTQSTTTTTQTTTQTTTETTTQTTTQATTQTTTQTTTQATTEDTTQSTNRKFYKHSFTQSGLNDDFFAISGNLSSDKGSVTYNGQNLTTCLKIESKTSITFNCEKSGKLTLVGVKNIKIDGTKITATNNIIEYGLSAGTHTITKADSTNLFYISFIEDGAGDINLDGKTDKADACQLLKYIIGINKLESELLYDVDLNQDGIIDQKDVILFLKQL